MYHKPLYKFWKSGELFEPGQFFSKPQVYTNGGKEWEGSFCF